MNPSSKPPILLVDDEPEMLFSLKGLLRREFDLHTAESGKEAMEILGRQEIHVVMTDQRMPEMTGVELVRRVKCQYPEAIRIVFTGYADIKSVVDAINRGGLYRYITKPWDPDDLIDLLRQAAAEYEKIVESKQLLCDMRAFLLTCRDAIDARKPGPSSDIEQLARMRDDLLNRLDRQTTLPPETTNLCP